MEENEMNVSIKIHLHPTDFTDALNYVKTYFKNSLKCEKKVFMYLKKSLKYDWNKNMFEHSARILEKYIELEILQRSSRIELLEHNIKTLEGLEINFIKYTSSKNFINLLKIINDFNKILEFIKEVLIIKKEIKEIEKVTPWENSKISKLTDKAKHVLKQRENLLHKVGNTNIALIQAERANFEEYPKKLSIIIFQYFEHMNFIRDKIIAELDRLRKKIHNNASYSFSDEFFKILKFLIRSDENKETSKKSFTTFVSNKSNSIIERQSDNNVKKKNSSKKLKAQNLTRERTIVDDNYVAYINHLFDQDVMIYDDPKSAKIDSFDPVFHTNTNDSSSISEDIQPKSHENQEKIDEINLIPFKNENPRRLISKQNTLEVLKEFPKNNKKVPKSFTVDYTNED